MAIRFSILAAVLAAAGCRTHEATTSRGPSIPDSGTPYVMEYADLDRYDGTYVRIRGIFDQIRGKHGVVTTDSGLKIVLPNFDYFARGEAWFDYVGIPVEAGGILYSWRRPVEGFHGPSLEVYAFRLPGSTP